ncbi:MAG TPA: TadE/TadG family type IV pilus assembly protein [Rhizomicrobium sp.]|nr:TadE/TadG family type IV pilus assembly protein [Rhizomicrobium sp.]
MMPRRALRKTGFFFKRLAANQDGIAAVEFAMLLPFMITLFFGVIETSMALLCRADVSIMASTAADLVSQADTLAAADISNVYSAAGTILYPYYDGSNAKPTIRVSSVIWDTVGKSATVGKVAWSCTQSGSGTLTPVSRAVNSSVTLPQALLTAGSSVIVSEIAYGYASPTTKVVAGSINFTNNFYTKPRRVPQIPTPTGGCPS